MNWEKVQIVLEGLDLNHQTYTMTVFYHGGVYIGLRRAITGDEDSLATVGVYAVDRFLAGFHVTVDYRHPGAFGGIAFGAGAADSRRAASNRGDLAFNRGNICHWYFPLIYWVRHFV